MQALFAELVGPGIKNIG